jgi:hypothetical protein
VEALAGQRDDGSRNAHLIQHRGGKLVPGAAALAGDMEHAAQLLTGQLD